MLNISRTNDNNTVDEKVKCPSKMENSSALEIVEKINKRNMMPDVPNYSLNKDDNLSLSKKRHISSIPKNGEEYWLYPSPQQFYNSLLRKNKEVEKDYIDAVVSIHNEINEESWKHVLRYEHMHKKKCSNVTLHRFVGKSDDLSLKARFRSIFTRLEKPFDRHDWFIDRCGTQIKYIIDYYNDESINDDKNIYIDVRPAMDSLSNIWDRVRYPFYEFYFKYIKKNDLFR
ncbi:cytochrome c heme lyase, putative [Plasmodium relictum]|uniref:Holocytochrome c-type synthase n=1 Tax=Plasmodium relictum TaxID=85471 RepID=A0A1J1HB61_PLARL|nr:cytochrome c heme lyase, putative [Plasmodium relictum]CRH02668.1 cytochrome c heme lyase, putative [Plasmodium relictum]